MALWYVAGFNGQWRIGRDSALYRQLGHNLAVGRGYVYLGQPHDHALPGLPILLAGCERVFGNSPLPALLIVLAMAIGALTLIYKTLMLDHPPWMAVVATTLTGFSGIFYEFTSEILTDMPFLFGLTMVLYGLERIRLLYRKNEDAKQDSPADDQEIETTSKSNNPEHEEPKPADQNASASPRTNHAPWLIACVWLVIGLAVCALFRPTFWIVAAALLAGLLWRGMRQPRPGYLALILATMLVVVVWWSLDPRTAGFNPVAGHDETRVITYLSYLRNPKRLAAVLAENIPKVFEDELPEAFFGVEIAPVVNSLLIGALMVGTIILMRRRLEWGLLVLGIVSYTILISPRSRYYLMVIPLLIVAWLEFWQLIARHLPKPHSRNVLIAAAIGLLLPNLIGVSKHMLQQRSIPFLEHHDHGRWASFIEAGITIRKRVGPQQKVIGPEARVLTYVSDRKIINIHRIINRNPPSKWGEQLRKIDPDFAIIKRPAKLQAQSIDELIDAKLFFTVDDLLKSGNFRLVRITTEPSVIQPKKHDAID